MRTLSGLNQHIDRFEDKTLTALERIVEVQLPKIAATGVANELVIETQQKVIDKLCERVAALEARPIRTYGDPNQ